MENRKYLSLLEFSNQVKSAINLAFSRPIWLIGEIASLKVNQQGHCYLELVEKAENSTDPVAAVKANIWAQRYSEILEAFKNETGETLKPGIKILFQGSVSYHPKFGLSINIIAIDPNFTLGEMARNRKIILERLQNEGLLELNKRLPLPLVLQRLAVISSSTAAGYQDFLKHLQENPYGYSFKVDLFPAIMQGAETEKSVISALQDIQFGQGAYQAVAIIRGGGAVSDLTCFDNYNLAAAVASFPLPVLTGIGHTKDISVLDYVSFDRFITPTAVAEFILKQSWNFETMLDDLRNRLCKRAEDLIMNQKDKLSTLSQKIVSLTNQTVTTGRHKLDVLRTKLSSVSASLILKQQQKLKDAGMGLKYKASHILNLEKSRFEILSKSFKNEITYALKRQNEMLAGIEQCIVLQDPMNIMRKGYSITLHNGKALKDPGDLQHGDKIETVLYEGRFHSKVVLRKEKRQDICKDERQIDLL